uniref:Aminopeptidase n=1 Tax=Compsopogon caeruleus TaxID=31354 RepID=A0A7S1TGN2_9RHOD|mmetsp:Transcript_6610/g.13380  ORF Transcript_6610/g.13380 Transcript_6610/m.13380 type:complete len:915 (+) Transcript_6610:53-2797(+)
MRDCWTSRELDFEQEQFEDDEGRGEPGESFALPGVTPKYGRRLVLEPVHMDLVVDVDIEQRTIRGRVGITIRARQGNVREVSLDAIDFEEISVSEEYLETRYTGSELIVTWPTSFQKEECREITVIFKVVNPKSGFYFSAPDEEYPDLPVLANTDHETERARYWLPCMDHPSVRTTLTVEIHARDDLVALSNGKLVLEKPSGETGKKVSKWKLDHPCPSYLLCIAVGDFIQANGGEHAGKPVSIFGPRNFFREEDLQRSFGRTKDMMDWMASKLDVPFPWPKYYQFVYSGGVGGAMENISLVSWADAYVNDEILAGERGWFVDLVNVHEMAHTFFGDAVVIRDFLHAWLKESWANYMELVWLEDTYGTEALHYQLVLERDQYVAEADKKYVRPLVTRHHDSSWSMFDSHLYPGGAWRLHMLRRILGDEVFWPAVSIYIQKNLWNTVETNEFRRILEDHSGLPLECFFDQWIYGKGFPKLKVSFTFNSDRGETIISVEQKQQDNAKGIGLFDFELEVEVETSEDVFQIVTVELRSSELEGKGSYALRSEKRPLQVVVDPNGKLLHTVDFTPGIEILQRTLNRGRTVLARCFAASALGELSSPKATSALADAASTESFWGVRRSIAKALGKIGSSAAVTRLVELCKQESDPRVVVSIVEALGHHSDESALQNIEDLLTQPDSPLTGHIAKMTALKMLGKQRGPSRVALLKRYLEQPLEEQWWGWVRRGAVAALGSTRCEESLQVLLEKLPYGAVRGTHGLTGVRSSIVEAIADCLEWASGSRRGEVVEILCHHLRTDKQYHFRMACARALSRLGDVPGSRAALHRFSLNCVNQDRPKVHRLVQNARRVRSRDNGFASIIAENESTKKDLRKLREKVDEMEHRFEALSKEWKASMKEKDSNAKQSKISLDDSTTKSA